MRYRSTRNPRLSFSVSEALQASISTEGGLFVPASFPRFSIEDFLGDDFSTDQSLVEIASRWLTPFFSEDTLARRLPAIVARTFHFPIPLRFRDPRTAVLELFHGPTAAFKDVGARFLAECLGVLGGPPRTVLVATSGDTGGAVAAAFHRRMGFEVVILFPKDKVSPRQKKQLTAWGDNVRALEVRGDFDDCQRLVKEAFRDRWWQENRPLLSANSINLGRLLPQAAYYVAASLWFFRARGEKATFLVPSGNLGNATGAMWARATGLPLGTIVLAMNTNRAVREYFDGGEWRGLPTVATIANAMDVGNPSNMERVLDLYPDRQAMKAGLEVVSVDDAEIQKTIEEEARSTGEVFCPHTATAVFARRRFPERPAVIVATAHPAKFDSVVEPFTEPILGKKIPVPPALEAILARRSSSVEIEPRLEALRAVLGPARG